MIRCRFPGWLRWRWFCATENATPIKLRRCYWAPATAFSQMMWSFLRPAVTAFTASTELEDSLRRSLGRRQCRQYFATTSRWCRHWRTFVDCVCDALSPSAVTVDTSSTAFISFRCRLCCGTLSHSAASFRSILADASLTLWLVNFAVCVLIVGNLQVCCDG